MTKKILLALTLIASGISTSLWADPYIVTSQGIGQYGYLELNATTYARLNHGGFNVRELAARWWTGAEFIYYTGSFGSCTQNEGSTSDYNSANHMNWSAGTIAYVSVRFKDCSFNWNSTNYNERSFRLIDVDNIYDGAYDTQVSDNPTGADNLVGSFTVNTGGNILTLDRLWLHNIGSAQEGGDITNAGIRIYYEAITGSEVFDGNESYKTIYGDWGGNSNSNEEWGSDDLNLPIGSAGVRCYVVVADLATGFVVNNTAQFEIMNDGISFQETRDGSYNLLRVNAITISPSSIPLPVTLRSFSATKTTAGIRLDWQTAMERDNLRFDIQRSSNGISWDFLASVASQGTNSDTPLFYTFLDEKPLPGNNYYRLQQVDADGRHSFSNIVKAIAPGAQPVLRAYPNPVAGNTLTLEYPASEAPLKLRIFDPQGLLLVAERREADAAQSFTIDLTGIAPGILFVQANDGTPQLLVRQ